MPSHLKMPVSAASLHVSGSTVLGTWYSDSSVNLVALEELGFICVTIIWLGWLPVVSAVPDSGCGKHFASDSRDVSSDILLNYVIVLARQVSFVQAAVIVFVELGFLRVIAVVSLELLSKGQAKGS